MLKITLATAALFSMGSLASAVAAASEPADIEMPTVVVSATGYQQDALLAPAAITVIERDALASQPVSDISEVFRDIPGVDIVDSAVPGMKRLSLRGENSRRVLIKVNGQPLADHSNYGTPLLIDVSMVERIEVVRGSASVVHGSNAIGGIINITTRKISSGKNEILLGSGYYSATEGYRVNGGILGSADNISWRLQVGQTEHGDRRIPHGYLNGTDSKQQSVSAELGLRFDDQQRITLQSDFFTMEANALADPANGIDYLGFPKRDSLRNAVSYDFEPENSVLKRLNVQGYYHSGQRIMENRVSRTVTVPLPVSTIRRIFDNISDDDLLTKGAQMQVESQLFGKNVTVLGLETQQDQLDTHKKSITSTQVISTSPPGVPVIVTKTSEQVAEQDFWSAFIQQQIILKDDLQANIGARYYDISSQLQHSTERTPILQSEDELVGSASLVWRLQQNASLRLNIAQGYTYPSVTQQFAVTVGGKDIHFGNPDLKSEKATTYELGGRIDGEHLVLDVALYRSDAKDFIDRKSILAAPAGYTGYTVPTATQKFWQWVNVNKAQTYGVEMTTSYKMGPGQPYMNASAQQRELSFANGYDTKDSGLPKYQLRTGVKWQAQDNLEFDMFARSYGNATRRDETGQINDQNKRYTEWNLDAGYQLSKQIQLNVALLNITNKRYQNIDELTAAGRAINIELNGRF